LVSLKAYLARRTLQAVPVVLGVIFLNFTIIHLAPGDPSYVLGGEMASPEFREELIERMGLNKPLWEQLFVYFATIFRGDLGNSIAYRTPVIQLIWERVPATFLLVGTAMLIAMTIGTIMGVNAARNPYSLMDNFTTVLSVVGYSTPSFWLAIMLMLLFGVYWNLLPTGGMLTVGFRMSPFETVIDVLRHLILPAFVLGLWHLTRFARMARASMLEELGKDYIVTAWAKGASERAVIYGHALGNALLPLVTMAGMSIPFLLTGAVVTETVFSWPGLGRLMFEGIFMRDYPVLMGLFIIVSIATVAANLLTDIVYALLDPRIRYK